MKRAWRHIWIPVLLAALLSGCSQLIDVVEQQAAAETKKTEAETLSVTGSTASEEAAETEDPDAMRLELPKSAAALGLVHLMEESSLEATDGTYQIALKDTEAEVLSDFITGRTDAALLSPESAARAYQTSKDDTVVVNICGGNDLYCITGNSAITSFQGLKGQEVLCVGQGEQPQYVLEYLVSQYGTRFQVSYVNADDILTLLTQNPMAAAIVTEPDASRILASVPGVQRAFSLKDSWENVAATGSLVSAVTVVHRSYYESNRTEVETLRREMALSIVKAGRDAAQTAKLSAKYGIAQSEIAEAALPYAGLRCTIGDTMNQSIRTYLGYIAEVNAAAIGQSMPGDTFFYGYAVAEPETESVDRTAAYDEDEDTDAYEDEDAEVSDTIKEKKQDSEKKQETKSSETDEKQESKKTDESKKSEETKKSDETKKSEESKKTEETEKKQEKSETKSAPVETAKHPTEEKQAPAETAAAPQPAAPDPSASPEGPGTNDDVISGGPVG